MKMFYGFKNFSDAFKFLKWLNLCIIICVFGYLFYAQHSLNLSNNISKDKIYVLANGKIMEAFASTRDDNIEVEARDHIATFHHYFFTLSPDNKQIKSNIDKALYLADGTAKMVYETLQENNYYSGIISGNISQKISIDSIQMKWNKDQLDFQMFATLTIVRPNSITERNLITTGSLRQVDRSENNSHGFIIEKWNILENKDLSTKPR